jgi:phosphomannomutase
VKAIIADIDDTICLSTMPVSEAMAREIDRIASTGRLFAFISGSTVDQLSGQLDAALTQPHHLLGATGTHYVKVHYRDGKPVREEVHREGFSEEERRDILGAVEALITKFDVRPLTTKQDQLQDRGSQITLSAVGRHAPENAKRAYDPDGMRRKAWLEFLKERLGDRFSYRIGGTTSVDITRKGIDKAWGIRRFLEHNRLSPHEALFFGDKLGPDGNDFPALSVVDCIEVRDPEHTLEILKCMRCNPGT